jgi:cupin 2 domain-containing protein
VYDNLPTIVGQEVFEDLLACDQFRVERIVSTGQATPAGQWQDQAWNEWVLVLRGAADVLLEGESAPRRLLPGGFLLLPVHCRHRVEWTDPAQPTIWLAIHYGGQP